MNQLKDILPSPQSFLKNIFKELQDLNINISKFECDHICYRVETYSKYLELKEKLHQVGTLVGEESINSRPISVFKLNRPLEFKGVKIPCIELPAPKKYSPYKERWEHVEFVLTTSFETFMKQYPKLVFEKNNMNKSINPDISIKLPSGVVKFHPISIEDKIKITSSK